MFDIELMGFRLEIPMSWSELRWLLSGTRRCPGCRGHLERRTSTRDEGFGVSDDCDTTRHVHTSTLNIEYECRRCRKWYTLPELTDRARR